MSMFCDNCGKKLVRGSIFCDHCGQSAMGFLKTEKISKKREKNKTVKIKIKTPKDLRVAKLLKSNWKKLKPAFFIIIAITFIAVTTGTIYGAVGYYKISKSIKEAEELTKAEKYNEAIGKLESIQNKWLTKNLGLKRQKIDNEIEKNKEFIEDKTEYSQGTEEFDAGNWGKANELLSKVSAEFFYYQDAQNKLREAQNKLLEEQIAEGVAKATTKIKSEVDTAKRAAEKAQKEFEEEKTKRMAAEENLEKKIESFLETPIDSAGFSPSIHFSSSIAKILCSDTYNSDYYFQGSGSVWWNNNRYWIMTNRHVLKGMYECIALITKDWSKAADDPLQAFKENEIIVYNISPNYSYVTEAGYDLAFSVLEKIVDNNQPLSLLGDVAMVPAVDRCNEGYPIGTKIKIFGYPGIGSNTVISLTEGIISSFEKIDNAYYYLTSAKIERGNSGGLALTDISENASCVVGVPTFVLAGDIESMGRILLITEKDIDYWLSTPNP